MMYMKENFLKANLTAKEYYQINIVLIQECDSKDINKEKELKNEVIIHIMKEIIIMD